MGEGLFKGFSVVRLLTDEISYWKFGRIFSVASGRRNQHKRMIFSEENIQKMLRSESGRKIPKSGCEVLPLAAGLAKIVENGFCFSQITSFCWLWPLVECVTRWPICSGLRCSSRQTLKEKRALSQSVLYDFRLFSTIFDFFQGRHHDWSSNFRVRINSMLNRLIRFCARNAHFRQRFSW